MSLNNIYGLEIQGCVIQSFNCLLYLKNGTIITKLYMSLGSLKILQNDVVHHGSIPQILWDDFCRYLETGVPPSAV
jgi:hypothetical protein